MATTVLLPQFYSRSAGAPRRVPPLAASASIPSGDAVASSPTSTSSAASSPQQPYVPSMVPPATAAQRQFQLELRHLALLGYRDGNLPEPSALWAALVDVAFPAAKVLNNKVTTPAANVDIDDLVVTRAGYERACRQFVGVVSNSNSSTSGTGGAASSATAVPHAVLNTEAFDRHRLASHGDATPAEEEWAPLVPLYSYLAKKLLLLRLRVDMEIAAIRGCSMAAAAEEADAASAARRRGEQEDAIDSTFAAAGGGSHHLSGAVRRQLRSIAGHAPLLSQSDVEDFIGALRPHVRLARDFPPWMRPYYLAHCSTRVMLTVDSLKSKMVLASRLMTSDALNELLALYEVDADDALTAFPVGCDVEIQAPVAAAARDDPSGSGAVHRLPDPNEIDPDAEMVTGVVLSYTGSGRTLDSLYTVVLEGAGGANADDHEDAGAAAPTIHVRREHLYLPTSAAAFSRSLRLLEGAVGNESASSPNWFSPLTALKVYQHFCALDVDNDGMLSRPEMAAFNNSSFTPIAIARVFQEFAANSDGLDFKQFLEFTHATEYPAARSSQRYWWRLLDEMGTERYIHVDVLRKYCAAVAECLAEEKLMTGLTGDSILAELMDMVNPVGVDRVTFADLDRSEQAATALPVMLDFRAFFMYDSREQLAAQEREAEQQRQ